VEQFVCFHRRVPTASLAAVLVYTGIKLVNLPAMQDLARFGRDQVAICLATLLLIVFTDLLTGVVVGIVLTAVRLYHRLAKGSPSITSRDRHQRATGDRPRLPRLPQVLVEATRCRRRERGY
jgi:MFS superfamily sulfate permease-like transporter